MKNILRRNILIIIVVSALFCSCAAVLFFGGSYARAEDRAVSHDHASDPTYTALDETGGELGVSDTTSYYYLTKNTVLQSNIFIASGATVTVCLNGYILCGTGFGNVINVPSGATLDICDCRAESISAEHKHYYSVSDNVWNFKDGSGAFLTGGDNYVTGGVITGGDNGGIYIDDGGTFNLSSGTIAGNKSSNGGGVYVYGTFNMQGGAIRGNKADNEGGGVYLRVGNFFTMSGGVISDNYANNGGGVYCASMFNAIGDIEITNNTAISNGGGVYVMLESINVGGGTVTIKDNKKSNGTANDVYLDKGNNAGKISIAGALNDGSAIGVYPNNCIGQYITHGYGGTDTVKYFFSDDPEIGLYINVNEVAVFDEWKVTLNLYKKNGEYVTDTRLTSYKYSKTSVTYLPTAPVRAGYVFEGWYTTPTFESFNEVDSVYVNSTGDKTYYAKWNAVPENNLLGDGIKFGKHNLWDCQRMPYYPLGGSPFYIYGFRAPLDVHGDRIVFNADDYVRFEPYAGGGNVTDGDGNGVITVGELGDSDKNRIVGTLYGASNAGESAILDALVVSEVKYDGAGSRTTLSNIGLIWALGEEGFLYTALDPDCGWSYSGGVGTFISFKPRSEDNGLSYVPDSPDPLGKDDLIKDSGGDDAVPVPTPDTAEPADNEMRSVVGIVVDGDGNPLDGASVSFGSNIGGDRHDTVTDENGCFMFKDLALADYSFGVTVTVQYGSYNQKDYGFGDGEVVNYDILRLVYPLNDTDGGTVSNVVISSVKYMNIEGASFDHALPATYTEGVGARLYDPTKPCHAFGGWYESADFTGESVTEISAGKRGDIVLYAKWSEAHTWGEWTVTRPATAEVDGEQSRTCSVCGKTETRAIEYVPEAPPAEDDPPAEDEPTTGDEPTADGANAEQPTEDKDSLLWLIVLLAAVLAAECVILILRMRSKNNKNGKDGDSRKLSAVLPFTAAAYPMGEIVAVAVLAAAVAAVGVAIACTFISRKDRKAVADAAEDNAADGKSAEVFDAADGALQHDAEVPAKPAPVSESVDDGEEQALENEVAAELENDEAESGGISLKESLALAAANAKIKIDKQTVAEWLNRNYGDEIILNRRANKTKTGLPLADTHYVKTGAKKKCFVYVYELDGDKSMLLLKTDDGTAREISDKHSAFVKSRFPRSAREKWYTLIPDSGFDSADEVFDVMALILSKYTENLRAASEEVRREIKRLGEIKKSNVTVTEAKQLVSDAAANALVTGRRIRKTGKKFAVNIDTLSAAYEADDTVDMVSLKSKGIVPRSAKQIKILARGMLDKPLTVIADDFSADAVKMIVLTGGEACLPTE